MAATTVTVFDGAGCIGGNKIHLQFGDHGLFFDFGMNFKKLNDFYQEYLQPRSARGIHDFLAMGIVPTLRCYRPDVFPSDVDLAGAPDLPVDAVFVSHAHMDHMGHAGFLRLDIPFVATPMSAAIMKAMKDCGQKGTESESVYGQPKRRKDGDGRVIETERLKKGERYARRDFVLTEKASPSLVEFWHESVLAHQIDSRDFLEKNRLPFEFRSYEVDHSIYGATSYAVLTPAGWVAYTGDLRIHGRYREKTERFVREVKALNPALLIIEGTRTSRDEEEANHTEEEVKQTCLRAVDEEKHMVVADFSARNFERLDTFLEIASHTGRRLVVTKKDAYYLRAIGSVDGIDRLKGVEVFDSLKVKETGAEEAACDALGTDLLDPANVAKAPEQYILCFSFNDVGNLLDIRWKGGTYVYSSSEAYSEEQVIDFRRLVGWLGLFELKIKGFQMVGEPGKEEPIPDRRYHASGHASTEDLIRIVNEIEPDRLLPVHTEETRPFKSIGSSEFLEAVPGRRFAF